MKTDNYLSLCLDQAAKSPLHYRHGCIIVRGGKVIGQGYNDYRPGYDGGSLKNGRVANGAFDGPAVANLKAKLKKQKEREKPDEKQPQQPQSQKNHGFVQFEGTGGGHGANTPLSMHSEMMAIHSAFNASSTMSCGELPSKKSCFKLPSGDKRKARLRQETLAAYVNAICQTYNEYKGQREDVVQKGRDEDGEEIRRMLNGKGLAFHAGCSGEKHHDQKNGKKKKGGKKGQGDYQHDRSGHQQAQQQQQSASNGQTAHGIRGVGLKVTSPTSRNDEARTASPRRNGQDKGYGRSGKTRVGVQPPQSEPMLLPKEQTASSARSVHDRGKHPRLNGADMYVARIGWSRTAAEPKCIVPHLPPDDPPSPATEDDADGSIFSDDTASTITTTPSSSATTTTSSSGSGSLHDELTNPSPSHTTTRPRAPPSSTNLDISTVRDSRPCYRCISYMHSVGIKRVFWTNSAGGWEGGKVRDLVDALDSSMERTAGGMGGPQGNGLFVTKHEVLMLKRMMGRREGGG